MGLRSELASDFFIITRQDKATRAWGWEIQRRSKPLQVRLHDDGFASASAAKAAARKVLEALLDTLAGQQDDRWTE